MIRRLLPFGILLVASCTPAQEGRAPGHYVDSIKHLGIDRSYILRVPKGYKSGRPTPVVFALHGLSDNMDNFAGVTKIEDLADREGFLCVIPNGLKDNFRGWNAGFFKMAGTTDDVSFIADVLNSVEKEFTTDKKRTYVFGHSNGAMMAYYLGGLMSDRFAAVAGIAGTIGIPTASSTIKEVPVPKNPISVLMIHGQMDPTVAYKKGAKALLQCTGAEDGAKWWAKQDGCGEEGITSDLKKDFATRTVYSKGKGNTEVVLISSVNGTHAIPGGHYASGTESASGVDAISEIWSFFKTHPKV